MRIEKEKAVQEREDYLLKMFEVQKDKLVAEAREEEQSRYAQEMDEMRLYFENKISQLLWECYEQVQQLEEQMQIEIDSLNLLWQARLEEEIQDTVEKITEEFLEKLRLQEQVLVSIFTKQIK
jgi:5'-deoxynucleotidase YfbR-like HD superfamily hydrolase